MKFKPQLLLLIFFFLTSVSTASFSANYTTNGDGTGFLVIPTVDIDGKKFVDNVSLKLDFAKGTFQLVTFDEKPATISQTPIATTEEQDIKMDLMGCASTGRNEITCHLMLTALGGLDQEIRVYAKSSGNPGFLYDNLGNEYPVSETVVGNQKSSHSVSSLLVSGIPTLTKFKFINVSPSANKISLFKPIFETQKQFTVDFREINF
jgi:hypothetical protein